ncbi:MAG TPA: hypothetical protein PL023_05415 [Thiobacillus sp.]|nr:hypothetical protein [Thiobacillus sp.]
MAALVDEDMQSTPGAEAGRPLLPGLDECLGASAVVVLAAAHAAELVNP